LFTYTGKLAKPLSEPIVIVGMLGGASIVERLAERRAKRKLESNLAQLFKWYGIDPKPAK
jgi:hypothetical protein